MKQQGLTPEQRSDLVAYRFERAHETLAEAKYLREGQYYNAAINRLYYCCFYAASGLLVSRGIQALTHDGVKTMLSKEFVRTGLLEVEHGSTFGDLFNRRHSSDYDDYVYNDSATVDYLMPRAEAFIDALQKLVTLS